MNVIRRTATLGLLGLFMSTWATSADAHTIAIGASNAGPGAVTVWLGTYEHGGSEPNEGSITLNGETLAFTLHTTSQPSGLIPGDTYFYADATPATWGTLPPGSFHSPTNISGLGPVVAWQGATFTGLAAGIYPYQISGMLSDNWNDINSFQPNWAGSVVVSGTAVGTAPEPASILLLGMGLVGAGVRRWRQPRA